MSGKQPTCPVCGSEHGVLGTSYAYFICHNPECPMKPFVEVYWLGDHRHPAFQGKEWEDAVRASPFAEFGTGASYFTEKDIAW